MIALWEDPRVSAGHGAELDNRPAGVALPRDVCIRNVALQRDSVLVRREDEPVLIPGDPERANRAARLKDGVPIDDETWREIVEAARGVNVLAEA